MVGEDRLDLLERRTEALADRLARLERELGRSPVVTKGPAKPESAHRRPMPAAERPDTRREPVPAARPRAVTPPPPPKAPKRERNIEDLLGGRVLAWIGGVAVLLGIAFFFALAISHGWIGQATRTLMAGGGSLALFGAGVWLHGRKGRTDAALAAVSTAIAGLFATVTVAAQVYHLVPALVGLLLAGTVGACGTSLAIRWQAKGIAALGIGGSLLAPVLVGAHPTAGSMAFLLVANGAASAVLAWQRWEWLAFAAFAVSTPQWVTWLPHNPSAASALFVLAGFGVLNLAAAIGFDVRTSAERLGRSSTFLLVLSALVLATVGWFWLASEHHRTAGEAWLVALAFAHLGLGLAERRVSRISNEIGIFSLALGVILADVAFGLIVSGPALAVGWAGGAVAFAIVNKRARQAGRGDAVLAQVGLGAHIALALIRTLVVDAPPAATWGGAPGLLSAAVALSALAAACLVSARLAADGHGAWRVALDSIGLAAIAYLTAVALDGPYLAIAWAGEAGALAQIARRTKDEVGLVGAGAFLAFAVLHILALDAPPRATVEGVPHLLPVAGCIATVALASFRVARAVPYRGWQVAHDSLALAAVAYLTAVALDGVPLTMGWAAEALAVAQVARRIKGATAPVGSGALLVGAALHTLVFDVPPGATVAGVPHLLSAVGCLSAVALGAFGSARTTLARGWREGLDGLAVCALAYLAAVALNGAPLAVALALGAMVLAEVARRTEHRVAAGAAVALVTVAGAHATLIEAPPSALVYGVEQLAGAAAAFLMVTAAAVRLAQLGTAGTRWRLHLAASGALLLLYLASVAVVSAFQPGSSGAELSIFDLGARQQGQVLLSALWSVVGVAALMIGLRRDLKAVRIGALALLLLTVGKVFLYDFAALTSVYRVASFVGLGLLLLAGAFAWQRMRPRALPDLRSTPRALR